MISLNKQFFLKQEKLDRANFYDTIYKTANNSNAVNTFNTDTFVNYDSNVLNSEHEESSSDFINPFNNFFNFKKKEDIKNNLNK